MSKLRRLNGVVGSNGLEIRSKDAIRMFQFYEEQELTQTNTSF